jgi:hypothetical protein
LAEGLLGEGGGESGAPPYLAELFEEIFVDADRSNSGTLSTLQLMTMLKRRAKGIFYLCDDGIIFRQTRII